LSAMTIASSLMGGCGLSHERVEDGYKSTCMKFRGSMYLKCSQWNVVLGH